MAFIENLQQVQDKPEPDNRKSNTPAETLKLLRHTFVGEKDADVTAVPNRAIVHVSRYPTHVRITYTVMRACILYTYSMV